MLRVLTPPIFLMSFTKDWATSQPGSLPSGRAILHDTWGFDPFRVTSFESLSDALEAGKVAGDTPLLVLTRGDTRLALLTTQMSYHHVAQGELVGEPWMVSF